LKKITKIKSLILYLKFIKIFSKNSLLFNEAFNSYLNIISKLFYSLNSNDIYEDEFQMLFDKRTNNFEFKNILYKEDINKKGFIIITRIFEKTDLIPEYRYDGYRI